MSRWKSVFLFLTHLFISACLIYVIWVNLSSVGMKIFVPEWFQSVGNFLYLDQYWAMYAPPGKQIIWFVIPGTLQEGTQIDLQKNGLPVSWGKPSLISRTFKNANWRKYSILVAFHPSFKAGLPLYASWVCNQWNQSHSPEKRLLNIEIFAMVQDIPVPGAVVSEVASVYEKRSILKHTC